MKNLFGVLIIAGLFSACEKKQSQPSEIKVEDTLKVKKDSVTLSVDSLSVTDSVRVSKAFTAEFSQKVLTFKGLQKQVLDSLYVNELFMEKKPMKDYSKESILERINERKKQYLTESSANNDYVNRDFEQHWEEISDMKIHSQTKDFLTINYNGYGYGGGAHGYGYDLYKTVDLKKQSIIQLSDLVDETKVKWQPILLKHVDREMLFDENITANRNFYFDNQSITFVYNQYEIGPYVSGVIEIKVPFSEIKQALKQEFKERLKIN